MKKKSNKKSVKKIETKKSSKLDSMTLRALKNFWLADGTFVKEGEAVSVSGEYGIRLLSHTPQAFTKA